MSYTYSFLHNTQIYEPGSILLHFWDDEIEAQRAQFLMFSLLIQYHIVQSKVETETLLG